MQLIANITKEFDNEPPIPKSLLDANAESRQTMTGRSALKYADQQESMDNRAEALGFNPMGDEKKSGRSDRELEQAATKAASALFDQK